MNGSVILAIVVAIVGALVGFAAGYLLRKFVGEAKIGSAEEAAKKVLEEANRRSEALQREARVEVKEELHKLRTDAESEVKERRQELAQLEKRLLQKESMLDEKQLDLGRREQSVADKEAYYKRVVEEAEAAKVEQQRLLEEVSGLTQLDAREILLKRAEDEVRHDMAKMVRNIEEEAKRESDRRARNILSLCIQRTAANHVAETTVSVVALPSDDMKGRIIGREGTEHPDAREPDRGGLHHRRHARGRRALRLRHGAPRDRPAHAHQAGDGRAHPPGQDRGDVLQG